MAVESSYAVPRCMRISDIPILLGGLELERLTQMITSSKGGKPSLQMDKRQAVELAVQVWRLGNRIERMKSENNSVRPLEDSYSRLMSLITELSIEIEDPTGKPYLDGWLEVEPISFEAPDGPAPDGSPDRWVKQVLKPIIRRREELLSRAEIVVAVKEQGQK